MISNCVFAVIRPFWLLIAPLSINTRSSMLPILPFLLLISSTNSDCLAADVILPSRLSILPALISNSPLLIIPPLVAVSVLSMRCLSVLIFNTVF